MANNNFNCPHCEKQIYIAPSPKSLGARRPNSPSLFQSVVKSPFGSREMNNVSTTLPQGDYSKVTPVSKLDLLDVLVSLADSSVIGSLCAVGSGSIFYGLGFEYPFIGGAVVGFVGFFGRYSFRINFAQGLTKTVENFVSEAVEQFTTETVEVPPLEVVHRNERGTIQSIQRFNHLPQNVLENLPHFAQQAEIKGLSVDTWTGAGGVFSKGEFSDLMSALAEAGIVEWVNPSAKAQGRRVTRSGARALAELAKMT